MNPPMTDPAVIAYFTGLMSAHVFTLACIVEVLAGVALITNAYVALANVVLMSVVVNALMFHVFFDPANIDGAIIYFGLPLFLMIANKKKNEGLLKIR